MPLAAAAFLLARVRDTTEAQGGNGAGFTPSDCLEVIRQQMRSNEPKPVARSVDVR